ncbi:MAG: YIP1 family protein [Mariprofundus sp.]|nr:YIP1 family protein [Mariprofundus sp.]
MIYFESSKPFQTFIPAIRSVLTSPTGFFTELKPTPFFSNAIFFISVVIFMASFIGTIFHSLSLLFLLPVTWGLSLIGMFFWAAYMSWAVKTLGKGKLTKPHAFQISAYAAAPLILSAIPVVGIIASLWNLYLLWLALIHRCKVKAGMAALIVAIPAVIFAASIAALLTLAFQVFPQLGQG